MVKSTYWCRECGRKQIKFIGTFSKLRKPHFRCNNCDMTFVCYKEQLDNCLPLELIKEIERVDWDKEKL